MKVVIVGGGPAGVYLGYLLKRDDPARHVVVLEQNPRDATYGFGVVFSDRALDFLEEDDPDTHTYLAPHMESWPDLKVVHRDTAVAIDGNGFASIERLRLLELLRARAEEAGAEIRYDTTVDSVEPFADADLVVGADGVNSLLRGAHQKLFGPRVSKLTNRFAWYGTEKPFDCLTLTFRQNGDGAFVAHHYRFAPQRSTFIVECDEATWKTAGLDRMSDADSRAYCEKVFGADLDGQPLLSNKSVWRQFPLITNDSWHGDNMVLIGDALRTVHFSIGSGTRLAMEDALALAAALRAERDEVAAALRAFEAARRPVVDKLLAAAAGSAHWYERMGERMHLDPYEFAHDYMTRTGRMTDERLGALAPRFMARYLAHTAERFGEASP